jgi:hypothetical protein
VSRKPANKPFLAHKERQAAHDRKVAALSSAKAQKKRNSQDKAVGHSTRISSTFSVRTLILSIIILPLISQYLTHSYTFSLFPIIQPSIQKYLRTSPINPWRVKLLEITPEELSNYDGSSEELAVLLGIGGEVYDVSANRRIYGKGGSYNMM